jgi:hypothetical protein
MIINVREIVDRLCQAWHVPSFKALTAKLAVGDSTVSSWISKEKIPYKECLLTAQQRGCTMDWLIMGKQGQSLYEPSLIAAIKEGLETASEIELISEPNETAKTAIAKLAIKAYKRREGVAAPDDDQQNSA